MLARSLRMAKSSTRLRRSSSDNPARGFCILKAWSLNEEDRKGAGAREGIYFASRLVFKFTCRGLGSIVWSRPWLPFFLRFG